MWITMTMQKSGLLLYKQLVMKLSTVVKKFVVFFVLKVSKVEKHNSIYGYQKDISQYFLDMLRA